MRLKPPISFILGTAVTMMHAPLSAQTAEEALNTWALCLHGNSVSEVEKTPEHAVEIAFVACRQQEATYISTKYPSATADRVEFGNVQSQLRTKLTGTLIKNVEQDRASDPDLHSKFAEKVKEDEVNRKAVAVFRPQSDKPTSATAQVLLWGALVSGMSPAEVQAALTTQGIRSTIKFDKDTSSSFVDVRDRVPVSGRKARLELGFVKEKLFYADIRYEVPHLSASEPMEFESLSRALAQKYSKIVTSADTSVTHNSTAAIIIQRAQRFRSGDLEVDLTVNESVSRGNVTDYVIVRYWREADADAFALSEQGKERREQQARDEKKRRRL